MRSFVLSLVVCASFAVWASAQVPQAQVPNQTVPPPRPAAGSTVAPAGDAQPLAPRPRAGVPRKVQPAAQSDELVTSDPQENGDPNHDQPATPVAGTPTAWCDVYLSQGSARDLAVFDSQGRYMADVREVNLWVQVAMKIPQVRLISWQGLYKPSDENLLQKQDLRVRKLVSVSAAEFQKLVTGKPAAAAAGG